MNLIESAKCSKAVKGSGLSRERVFRWNSTRNDACRNSCQTPPGQGGVYFFSCFAASIMAFKAGISFISGAELLNVRI